MTQTRQLRFTTLSGGVGGAKLVLGLNRILGPQRLQVIANTGDDFEHLGLPICPDIDTLLYTLADVANRETGWGRHDESWHFMDSLAELGEATWFRLGDRDLATHIRRRSLLHDGTSLAATTQMLGEALGVRTAVWPMSEDAVRTYILTHDKALPFQDYFVRLQAEPVATGFEYRGAAAAHGTPGALAALRDAGLGGIIIAPSNPWLSIDPILSLSDIKSAIIEATAPVIAVSPIVAGQALKGPTAKLMRETGLVPSVESIAKHYGELLDGLVIDERDSDKVSALEAMGIKVGVTQTIMNDLSDKIALAEFVVGFAESLDKRNI